MNDEKWKISRPAIGVISLLLLAAAGVGWYLNADEPQWPAWLGYLSRLGIMIGAIWIASARWFGPGGTINLSTKALLAVVAVLSAISIRPRISIPAIIVIGILWFVVRPRNPKSKIDRSKNRNRG